MGEQWTRRQMLRSLAAAGVGAVAAPRALGWPTPAHASEPVAEGWGWDDPPFRLGVSSGYPTPDSVILWTRLAPEPLAPDGGLQDPVSVTWVVAANPDMTDVVASGNVTAHPQWGHSVHVDVTGLDPATTYWYRFHVPGDSSRVGRTRTAPDGPTDHLRFAVGSCQRFNDGRYVSLRHVAEEDLDFFVHLGDYVYEGSMGGGNRPFPGGLPTPTSVEEWRVRYAVYLGDPWLRLAHSRHPWLLTWDDHEVRNDYQGTNPDFAHVLPGAYQAYYEHLPLRLTESGPPDGGSFRIYQQSTFGDLLDVAMLDTRQYRTRPSDINQDGDEVELVESVVDLVEEYPHNHPYHADVTMLGTEQKNWLKDLLSSSTTAWRVLGNSVHFMGWAFPNNDEWDAYAGERRELLQHILDNGIKDVVSVTGDQHRHMWNHVRLDKDVPTSEVVLPEFGGAALNSNNDGNNEDDRPVVYASSPFLRYYDADTWGYMVCDVTRNRWRTEAWAIRHSTDPNGNPRMDPDAAKYLLTAFEVDRGSPIMRHAGGEAGNPVPDPIIEVPLPSLPLHPLPSLPL